MAGAALGLVGNLLGGLMGNKSKEGNLNAMGYNWTQNVLGGRNPGKKITGQANEEQSQGGGGNGLMDMIMGMMGNKGGAIQGGVGGTNTGMQTQNVLGRNRTFGTWSPYK
jgi:hypothetical protein